jgi:hypothetical protein
MHDDEKGWGISSRGNGSMGYNTPGSVPARSLVSDQYLLLRMPGFIDVCQVRAVLRQWIGSA